MNELKQYIIEGGDAGARRLHVLARAVMPGTLELLNRAGIRSGMKVLDLGCGSGEVTVAIAEQVGPGGRVVGIDMDEVVLAHARKAADKAGVRVDWRCESAETLDEAGRYDLVYARFLLSHLSDPAAMLRKMLRAIGPEGVVVLEDIEIASHTHWPPCQAFLRYIEIYQATARLRGVDPDIGPRLPTLAIDANAQVIDVSLSMPVFISGEGKSVARLTLASIANVAISSGITQESEITELLAGLEEHEADPCSLQSIAQVYQVILRSTDDNRQEWGQ